MRPLFRTHHGVSYVARDHDDVVLEVLFAKALDPAHVAVLVDVDVGDRKDPGPVPGKR